MPASQHRFAKPHHSLAASPRRPVAASLFILAAALLAGTSPARADWTLTSSDFSKTEHLNVNTWTSEGISATDSTGKLVQFNNRDLVALSSGAEISKDPALKRIKLVLRNGDTILGEANGFSGQSLIFRVPEFSATVPEGQRGGLAVPLKQVALVSNPKIAGQMLPVSAPDKDVVRLGNGDTTSGLVTSIDSATLAIAAEGSDTPSNIPMNNVAAVSFGGAAPPRVIPPLSVRLNLISGTSYTIPLDAAHGFNWTLSKIKFKDSAGREQTIDDASHFVASVEVLGGRVVFLTELDPLSEEQVSFLGTRWPMQVNQNVMGQGPDKSPLQIGHVKYERGIGVHTQDTLVYQLDGSFETLAFRVGLDDTAVPQGEAKVSVILDGKTLWQSDVLKPGQISKELSLPIAGGRRLELHADPATHLDVQGRVDWINVALRRK